MTDALRTPRALLSSDLVGAHELAQRARVSRTTVHQWRMRHPDFPAPVVVLAMGALYSWPDVATWLETPRPTGIHKT
jgi:hypothetical protein